ncbi:MAG: hydantoinase B/oxoprolinase family protein [Dehalococcoidales bacterium]|nr:hydantoinase B/oxoprolinase family protein [Dehalococcoidales bacterium]
MNATGSIESEHPKLDTIRFEVIRNVMHAFVEEMAAALARSAYSTNIKTRRDHSCTFFDARGKMVDQASDQPSHLGALVFSVPAVLKEYGVENLEPGDGVLVNDAHRGLVHLNDVCLISPIHYHGEIFGYVANAAHHVDIGGRAPGSIAMTTDIFQEGVIIPGVKFVKGGEIDKDMLKWFTANVRGKKESAGDLRAQVASNKLGARRIVELLDKYGVEVVNAAIEQLHKYTECRVRHEFARFPEGIFEGDAYVDDDGITDQPICIKAKVVIKKGDMTVDLSDSDRQRRGPMNCTFAQTYSSAAFPIRALLPPDLPMTDGFDRMVKVIAPKGTVVNCTYPSAVVGGWEVGQKTVEAVLRAFSKALPDRVPAETKKTILHIAFGGVDPRSQEYYVFLETNGGGFGARPTKDGVDAVQPALQNAENSPIEELEVGYPVQIVRYELIPDSEGAGKFRGGLGLRRDYRFRDHEANVTILADTAKFPARGIFGGRDGRTARYLLNPCGKNFRDVGSKSTFYAGPTDIVSMQTPGGGGCGDPREREPTAVLDDVRCSKTSLDRAREVYGVVINPESWSVDLKETSRLRKTRGGTRGRQNAAV